MFNSLREFRRERLHRKFNKVGRQLRLGMPELFLTLEVFDKDGNRVCRRHRRAHSFNRNAYNLMMCGCSGSPPADASFGAGSLSYKNTSGGILYGAYTLGNGSVTTGAAGDDYSILIGTDDTAESFEDYTLVAQVVDGTGVGEMSHVASEVHDVTWTGGTLTIKDELVRYFNNNSGAAITIKEIAFVMRLYRIVSGYSLGYVQLVRDVLGSPLEIADEAQLKVTYTVSLIYPE